MIDAVLAIPSFIIGIFFLWKGSDILVEGTSNTAAKLGISSIIISLIIVAFGTSAPEFAISLGAALQNRADILYPFRTCKSSPKAYSLRSSFSADPSLPWIPKIHGYLAVHVNDLRIRISVLITDDVRREWCY